MLIFRDFVSQRMVISENNKYFCLIASRPLLIFGFGYDFCSIILFENEFFKFLSNIYKYYVLAAKKKPFDETILLVECDKVSYKLKVFNDLKTNNQFDIRLMKGNRSVLVCKTYKDLVKVLLNIRDIFLPAITANASHIKSCETLILRLSKFLSNKEELISIFEGFKTWKHLARPNDSANIQYWKTFLKCNADYIIQYIRLVAFVDSENKEIMNFNFNKNSNSSEKLGSTFLHDINRMI